VRRPKLDSCQQPKRHDAVPSLAVISGHGSGTVTRPSFFATLHD
jgi:hypothetical protein